MSNMSLYMNHHHSAATADSISYGSSSSIGFHGTGIHNKSCDGRGQDEGPRGGGPIDEVTAPGDVAKSSSTLRPKEKRTLWIGDLDRAEGPVDDNYVKTHMFYEFSGYITNVRICRDRISRQPSFGFVEFISQNEAHYVLEHMNGRFVPGRMHKYRLNWANFNLTDKPEPRTIFSRPAQLNKSKQDDATDCSQYDLQGRKPGVGSRSGACPADSISIWVGSLDPSTCREEVEELFEQHYSSVCLVKLIMDPNTGVCKGFGFVHFRDSEEAERALDEMNGAVCRGRRIRVNRSNNSRAGTSGTHGNLDPSLQNAMTKLYAATAAQAKKMAAEYCGGFVPTKRKRGVLAGGETTKVVVRGLDAGCSEEELRRHFGHFGEVIIARVAAGGKAYITFAEPAAASNAIHCMNGAFIGTIQVYLELASGQTGDITGEARDVSGACNIFYEGVATDSERNGEAFGQYAAGAHHALGVAHATQFPHFYQMPYAQYGAVDTKDTWHAFGTQASACGPKMANEKGAEEEDDLSGRMFRDADPTLVPPELLPTPMFTLSATSCRGTMERHVFSPDSPCQARLEKDDVEKFDMETMDDELTTCNAAIVGTHRKRLKFKVTQGLPLEPEDQEYLYSTLDSSLV